MGEVTRQENQVACVVGHEQYRTELIFGRDRENEEPVSEKEWRDFVATSVSPRFTAGLTMYDAQGQYRSDAGVLVCEASKVIVLLHMASEGRSGDIEAIRQEYKERFKQEAVLRIDSVSCVDV